METTQSPDEIRARLVAQYEQFKPSLLAYHEYATRVSALAVEYHNARLKELYELSPVEELTLALTLDARETPKSLDEKLTALIQTQSVPKRIIFDRIKSTYYIFV